MDKEKQARSVSPIMNRAESGGAKLNGAKDADRGKVTQMIRPNMFGAPAGASKNKNMGKLSQLRNKIDVLRALMRPESNMFRTRIPKTLEFGHEFTTSYKRHTAGGQVKKIFFNKNIRSFVSYNEKQLHVWRADNGQQVMNINFFDETQSHTISCIVYSSTHMLYFAISTDFKLHIFNEHLIRIGWLPLKVRLVHFAYFCEEKSMLITGGIDGCFMFKIHVKSKYDAKQAVILDPEGAFCSVEIGAKIKFEKMPLWIKGLKVDVKQDIVFSWSQLKACFNDLNGKILNRYKKLTNYEDYITDILISDMYRYFVTSTFTGNIIVWKRQKKKQLVHTFSSHTKCVTSLQDIPDQPTLFISASNDNTIRIFSLDKFMELYCFILPAGVTNIDLLNDKIFACFYNDQIKIGTLHHLALSFYSSKIEVKKIYKIFKNKEMKQKNASDTIMTLFSDNSVQLQSSDRSDPRMISTIYPPPGAKDVMFLGYCMNLDRIFIMLVTGTLCIYRFDESETAILEKLMHSNEIKDSLSRSLSQTITAVTFCQTIPPKFDTEIFTESSVVNFKLIEESYMEQKNKYPDDLIDRFMAMGLSKGTVVFVSVDQIDHVYARFFFHRQAITSIVELPEQEKFITICEEMNICLWGFKDHRSYQLSSSQMYRPLDQIERLGSNIMMGFKSGDLQFLRFDEQEQDLVYVKTDNTFEHYKTISDLGSFEDKNLFISGDIDGLVKVWNIKKDLLREIKFPEPVYSVSFLNDEGDIIVGHHGKVSTVSFAGYAPDEISRLYQPKQEDILNFYNKKKRVADSDTYYGLKLKDDEIKRQNMLLLNQGNVPKVQRIKIASHGQSPKTLSKILKGGEGRDRSKSRKSRKGRVKITEDAGASSFSSGESAEQEFSDGQYASEYSSSLFDQASQNSEEQQEQAQNPSIEVQGMEDSDLNKEQNSYSNQQRYSLPRKGRQSGTPNDKKLPPQKPLEKSTPSKNMQPKNQNSGSQSVNKQNSSSIMQS